MERLGYSFRERGTYATCRPRYFARKRRIEQSEHSSCVRSMDCNIVNEAICLTSTLLVIGVVVGGRKKSLVSSFQIRGPQHKVFIDRALL